MTRSICACCQFLRKDKPIPNSEDLEAGVKSELKNNIPIMLDIESLELKIKNYNTKDNFVTINENSKYNNDIFHTARTAREDIVKDYKTMEQLVREIRIDHGIVDTPRISTIDITPVESLKIDTVSKNQNKINYKKCYFQV
uniref:Ragulator complex protein LAMTOR1 n=1 Tax=Strongyloides venezuelensis TaxID=75913 RepID=A0A0K0F8Q2_STRVS